MRQPLSILGSHTAQPIIVVHEGEIVLEPAVEPQAGQLRRLVVFGVIVDRVPAEADRRHPEIHRVGHPDDQQSVEIRVVGEMLEQGAGVGANMETCTGRTPVSAWNRAWSVSNRMRLSPTIATCA